MAKTAAKKKTTKKKAPAPKKPHGRPTKYSTSLLPKLAELMAKSAMIDKDMAAFIGISESTFHKWKIDHPDFAAALIKGKQDPDDKVEAALFQSAMGHHEDEFTQVKVPGPDGEDIIKHTTMTRRYIAPQVAAQIFWSKNRRPDRWKDKQEVSIDMDSDPLMKVAQQLADFRLENKND